MSDLYSDGNSSDPTPAGYQHPSSMTPYAFGQPSVKKLKRVTKALTHRIETTERQFLEQERRMGDLERCVEKVERQMVDLDMAYSQQINALIQDNQQLKFVLQSIAMQQTPTYQRPPVWQHAISILAPIATNFVTGTLSSRFEARTYAPSSKSRVPLALPYGKSRR